MKKLLIIFSILFALILAACLDGETSSEDNSSAVVSNSEAQNSKEESVSELSTPEVSIETSKEVEVSETSEVSEESETSAVSDTSVAGSQTSESEVSMDNKTPFVGVTEKGFTVKLIDGVYYVDGTLIANKTYGLPKNYPVSGLTSDTYSAYLALCKGAKEDGFEMVSVSDFRNYALQEALYIGYCNKDGKEMADTYSARPGHSEHQTGMAIDLNSASSDFVGTPEAQWIAENCWKYGFVVRYPEGKEKITGYMFEPWHVRYVGNELAEKLYLGDGEYLTLEEYFGITSEYAN